jgi:transposase
MYYVGLDVHARRSSLCILDTHGKPVKQLQVIGGWDKLLDEVARLPRPMTIGYEASCGYGYLHGKLSKLAERVVVGHPGQLRLIFKSKKKHDRIDGARIAKLLYLDAMPAVHVPAVDVRDWRALITYRRRLVERRAAVKTRVRALLRENGIVSVKGLFSKKGLAWLSGLDVAPATSLRREMMVDELGELGELGVKITRVERALAKIAAKHPGVALLMTIPGVGIRTAEAVVAWVDDVRRFARVRQVGSYFGLVPCQDASAEKNRLGHITKDGPATVRKLLCEAAWQGVLRSPTIKRFFERIGGGKADRRKIAVVATAHYLSRVMAAMLRSGEAWRESVDAAPVVAAAPLRKTP